MSSLGWHFHFEFWSILAFALSDFVLTGFSLYIKGCVSSLCLLYVHVWKLGSLCSHRILYICFHSGSSVTTVRVSWSCSLSHFKWLFSCVWSLACSSTYSVFALLSAVCPSWSWPMTINTQYTHTIGHTIHTPSILTWDSSLLESSAESLCPPPWGSKHVSWKHSRSLYLLAYVYVSLHITWTSKSEALPSGNELHRMPFTEVEKIVPH